MRRIILRLILVFGRFATIPVSVAGLGLVVAWLTLVENHQLAALILAPVAIPFAVASVSLAVGLLVLPQRERVTDAADDVAAPGLWAIWDEFDSSRRRSRKLRISDDMNAMIGEQWAYLRPFRRRVTMIIGLPLLLVLDAPAIRAVIAHEVAHAKLQHTSGGANLGDFIQAARNLIDYGGDTVSGHAVALLLRSLLAYLHKEYLALSRQNELAADGHAAEHVGRPEMARALLILDAAHDILKEIVFEPLEQELLGAVRAPTPPMQRIREQLAALRDPERINAVVARLMQVPEDLDRTHPSLRARLDNLGYAVAPKFAPALSSAGDCLLAPGIFAALMASQDSAWARNVNALVEIY
jgi:Zn-dependent protease with chaperone function